MKYACRQNIVVVELGIFKLNFQLEVAWSLQGLHDFLFSILVETAKPNQTATEMKSASKETNKQLFVTFHFGVNDVVKSIKITAIGKRFG